MQNFYLKNYSIPTDSYTGFYNQTPFYFYLSTDNLTVETYNINLYAQNSNSAPYQIPQNKWSHLLPQWGFYDSNENFIEKCNTWVASSVSSNGSILSISSFEALSSSGNFSGLIYLASAYYIDSLPSTSLNIVATLETSGFYVSSDNIEAQVAGYSNSLIFTETDYTVKAPPVTSIKITQDGKNPIDKIKWATIPVPYVVTFHADTTNTTYNSNIHGLTSIDPIMFWFPCQNGLSSYLIRQVNDITDEQWEYGNSTIQLSANDQYNFKMGGFYRGYFTTESEQLSTSLTFTLSSNILSSCTPLVNYTSISATSNLFNVKLFQTPYEIRRYNESFDLTNTMRSYALADITHNNNALFNFINESVGGLESNYQSIGRQFYEKIANFVDNNSDVDVCNFDQIYSLAKEIDVPIDDYKISYPSQLRRLMDIISINHKKLWGETCKCNRHFYNADKCPVCNHTHAFNRGLIYTLPNQYVVTANNQFVVENIYANVDYNRYNVIYPSISDTMGNAQIALSSLPSVSWMLSSNYFKFYIYEYIPATCNVQNEGVINWGDTYTTLLSSISSIDDWYSKDGIVEELFNFELHRGLYSDR